MKNFLGKVALLLVLTALPAFAGKKAPAPDDSTPQDKSSLVTAVSAGSAPGTGTITIGTAPFAVIAGTTITLDGKPAAFKDVQVGQKVVSHTASDSSAPEIDLKTPLPAPEKPKHNKKQA